MGLTQKLGTIPLAIQTDSSNNVGIGGAANASYKLAVTGAGLFTGALTANNTINTYNSTGNYYLSFYDTSSSNKNWGIIARGNNIAIREAGVNDHMTFLAGGSVLIGTTSTAVGGILSLNGDLKFGGTAGGNYSIINYQGGYLAFGTDNTERMRITSAGNLDFNFVNTAAAYVQINQATNQDGGIVFKRNLANRFQQTLNSGDGMQFYSYGISTTAFVINYGGSASLYGALTQNASDRRLKNNIQNIPNALDKINAINGVTFEWDNTIYKTDRTNDVGIIAQEIQAVLPEAVTLAPFDNDGEGNSKSGENYLTAYYEKLIPLLIEGIKELSAKVTALENK